MMTTKKVEMPIQYKKGWVEFYKLKFAVTPDCLIPRPETELLVDEVLKYISAGKDTHSHIINILDIGTGSGCIAIALAKNTPPTVNIMASDISEQALRVAQKNAHFNSVGDRIEFTYSNLLDEIEHPVDIIVCNLPYIPSARIPYLDPEVKDYEPHIALDGGTDGFELYRELFTQIKAKDWHPKLLVGEIDYTQGEIALHEARSYLPSYIASIHLDLSHKQRILKVSPN